MGVDGIIIMFLYRWVNWDCLNNSYKIIKLVNHWQAATKAHVLSIQKGVGNYQDLYDIVLESTYLVPSEGKGELGADEFLPSIVYVLGFVYKFK